MLLGQGQISADLFSIVLNHIEMIGLLEYFFFLRSMNITLSFYVRQAELGFPWRGENILRRILTDIRNNFYHQICNPY